MKIRALCYWRARETSAGIFMRSIKAPPSPIRADFQKKVLGWRFLPTFHKIPKKTEELARFFGRDTIPGTTK